MGPTTLSRCLVTGALVATAVVPTADAWCSQAANDAQEPRVRPGVVEPTLQAKINAAIDAGVEYLLDTQTLDGSWSQHQPRYISGQTALAVYSLAKSGHGLKHPAVRRGLDFIRAHPPVQTYEVACALQALTTIDSPMYTDLVTDLADLLISYRQAGGFGYPAGAGDVSTTHYGALGVRTAARHGVDVSATFWVKLAEATLQYQEEGAQYDWDMAGFSYNPGQGVGGSRTVAALTALACAREQLAERGGLPPECERSMQRGLAWLSANFSASTNPGMGGAQVYYYLYGLERVAALLKLTKFGDHAWYIEGASFLVGKQAPDGSWGNQTDTCFALLFLLRATAMTGAGSRKRINYGSDDPTSDVSLRASGDSPLTMWISSFGDHIVEDFSWPAEEGGGLRVARVQYLQEDAVLVDDARSGSTTWAYDLGKRGFKLPAQWTTPEYSDRSWRHGPAAFGRPGTPDAYVRTDWTEPKIWLRHSFEIEADQYLSPRLVLNQCDRTGTSSPRPTPSLLCLFDEESGFANVLQPGKRVEGDTSGVTEVVDDTERGQRALRIAGKRVARANLPGWDVAIAENPKPGQYRYLRFAWKKPKGKSGMVFQLATGKNFNGRTLRYFAGPNSEATAEVEGHPPAIRVGRRVPREWRVITVDLFEDFGAVPISGLAIDPQADGALYLDGIYLARSHKDFRRLPKLDESNPTSSVGKRMVEASAQPIREVYLNGQLVHAGVLATDGYVVVTGNADLSELLRAGTNTVAAVVSAPGAGQAFDLGIRARRVLAMVEGNRDEASSGERYAARTTFPRSAKYDVSARVLLIAPPGHHRAGEAIWLEAKPLTVSIRTARDPVLLAYASDSVRNLFRPGTVQIVASSELSAQVGADKCIDGLLNIGWMCSDRDTAPKLTITMKGRPVRGNRLLLSHAAAPGGNRTTRIWRVRVTVNGSSTGEVVEMDPRNDRKTVVELGKPRWIRSIALEVLEWRNLDEDRRACGFSEVELRLAP